MSLYKLENQFQEKENQADDKTSEVNKISKKEERERILKEFFEIFIEFEKVRTDKEI